MLFDLLEGSLNSLQDVLAFLETFFTSLPAFVIALVFHETAHAYVALRCGDPTARLMGRLTLNPLKHLDLKGFLCMLLVGVGWAKPVPVNPNNFKNPRRDDFLVSVAGICTNLILFLLNTLVMYAFISSALSRSAYAESSIYLAYRAPYAMGSLLITPELGRFAGYAYDFFMQLAVVDLSLAIFNLLPVPPLDGYHVLNDLILKGRRLFASGKVQQIGMAAIIILLLTGVFDKALSFLLSGAFSGLGAVMFRIVRMTGIV